jgi:hypothetical protein
VTDSVKVSTRANYRQDSSASILPTLCEGMLVGQPSQLFGAIPPERIGLNGEYDHDGLAKRVALEFSKTFEPDELGNLKIAQRGTVVVLLGNVPSQEFLIKLVAVVMGVSGAVDVEINGVCVAQPLRFYLEVKPSKQALLKLMSLITPRSSLDR